MRTVHWWRTLAALALVGGLTAGGIAGGWAAAPATFIWGKTGEADTLDMAVSSNGEAFEVGTQIFNVLVRAKPGSTDIEPDLATSWSVSADGLLWTFKLRQGVTFQDGTPWNADAAKFNFDRWADPQNPYHAVPNADYQYFNSFLATTFLGTRVVDPYTLEVVLKQPDSPFLQNLTIIPFGFNSPAAIQKYGAQGIGQHPVGTGPFQLVEWVRNDHMTLQANPTYFRRGLPKSARLIMRPIVDNGARLLALRASDINAMEGPNVDDVKGIAADPHFKLAYRPPFSVGWVRFNMNTGPFTDRRLRQAVAVAINRQAIVQGLYGDFGQLADQYMPPGMWGRGRVATIPYDPALAKKLLSEAGQANGFSFDLWYLPFNRPYFPASKDIATAIASDLDKVGIHANLMTEDVASYLRDRNTNKFPAFMIGWIGDNGDPDDWMGYFFRQFNPQAAYYSYNNPTALGLIDKARTMTDQAQRAMMYAQATQIIMADYRDVPIAWAKLPLLLQQNVDGLVGQPSSMEYMETVAVK